MEGSSVEIFNNESGFFFCFLCLFFLIIQCFLFRIGPPKRISPSRGPRLGSALTMTTKEGKAAVSCSEEWDEHESAGLMGSPRGHGRTRSLLRKPCKALQEDVASPPASATFLSWSCWGSKAPVLSSTVVFSLLHM